VVQLKYLLLQRFPQHRHSLNKGKGKLLVLAVNPQRIRVILTRSRLGPLAAGILLPGTFRVLPEIDRVIYDLSKLTMLGLDASMVQRAKATNFPMPSKVIAPSV